MATVMMLSLSCSPRSKGSPVSVCVEYRRNAFHAGSSVPPCSVLGPPCLSAF